jgi:hypothetical protein
MSAHGTASAGMISTAMIRLIDETKDSLVYGAAFVASCIAADVEPYRSSRWSYVNAY